MVCGLSVTLVNELLASIQQLVLGAGLSDDEAQRMLDALHGKKGRHYTTCSLEDIVFYNELASIVHVLTLNIHALKQNSTDKRETVRVKAANIQRLLIVFFIDSTKIKPTL